MADAADAGVSVGLSGGFWQSVGNIPGFAEMISISVQVFIVEVGISLVQTFDSKEDDPSTWWNPEKTQGFTGFMFDVRNTVCLADVPSDHLSFSIVFPF